MIAAPPHHRYPDVTWADLRDELEEELRRRRAVYPQRVAKGHMLAAEAEREIALAAAVREDLGRFERRGGGTVDPAGAVAPTHRFSWRERRDALDREFELRARHYPGWVAKGNMTQATADRRRHVLACVRALYEWGHDWTPTDGTPLPLGMAGSDGARAPARMEWHTLQARCAARDGREAEQEGFLRMIALDDPATASEIRAMLAPQQELAL